MRLTLTQLDTLLLSQEIMVEFDTETGSIFTKDARLGELTYTNNYTANPSSIILRALARKQEKSIRAAIDEMAEEHSVNKIIPPGGSAKTVDISPASAEEEAGQTSLFPKYPKELHEGDQVELFPNPDSTYKTVDEIVAGGPSLGSFLLTKMLCEEINTDGTVTQTWGMKTVPDDGFVYEYTILVNRLDPSDADEKTHEG